MAYEKSVSYSNVYCCCGYDAEYVAQALEPALDPLPDLSAYPTQLLVNGQSVESGAMPRSVCGTVLLPLRSILEQAGYTVDWDSQAQGAAFSLNSAGAYLLHMGDGALILEGKTLWTDPKAVVLEGTTYVSADLFDYVEGVSAEWDGATNTAVVTTDAPRNNVYCYDLGEGTLTQGKRELALTGCRASSAFRRGKIVLWRSSSTVPIPFNQQRRTAMI